MGTGKFITNSLLNTKPVTIIATTETEFGTEFLGDNDPGTICKVISGSIQFSFPNPVDCWGVVILNHSGMASATFEASGNNFDTVDGSYSMTVPSSGHAYYVHSSLLNFQYFRIIPGSCPVTIGQVFLIGAAPYTFPIDVDREFNIKPRFRYSSTSNLAGLKKTKVLSEIRAYGFNFSFIDQGQRNEIIEAVRGVYVLFSIEGDAWENMIFGELYDLGGGHKFNGHTSLKCGFEEQPFEYYSETSGDGGGGGGVPS